ncbi:MAG: hypothetical protein WD766_06475 [Gemmatimonadota bacterium]
MPPRHRSPCDPWLSDPVGVSPAVHLFEKFGFVPIPRYNSNPDADLFMEMVFSDPVPARHG